MAISTLTESETDYSSFHFKYFSDSKQRVSLEEFRVLALRELSIDYENCNRECLSKTNHIIERAHNDYIKFCELFDAKKIKTHKRGSIRDYLKQKKLDCSPSYLPIIELYNETCIVIGNSLCTPQYKLSLGSLYKSLINVPRFSFDKRNLEKSVIPCNTPLMTAIANTREDHALSLIQDGADINQYSFKFGNCPFILAIAKGYNHISPDSKAKGYKKGQKEIITELLIKENLDINSTYLKNGMTALHIACLRGDSPKLIELLLKKGASATQVDYMGRFPVDYLNASYEAVKEIIGKITDASIYPFGDSTRNYSGHISFVATLPTRKQREENIEQIKLITEKKRIDYITQKLEKTNSIVNNQTFFFTLNSSNLPKPDLETYSLSHFS